MARRFGGCWLGPMVAPVVTEMEPPREAVQPDPFVADLGRLTDAAPKPTRGRPRT
jgi:hypothetical protein